VVPVFGRRLLITISAAAESRRNPIYAIVRSGGRQYRVEPDQLVDVDLLEAEVGSTVDLNVLLLAGNGEAHVGTPLVDGAKVVAEVIEHLRADKIRILKYKNKTRRRQRMGHRQDLTRLHVTQIVTGSGDVIQVEAKPKRARKPAPEPEPEAVTETAVEAAPEAEAEEAPKPRRTRRTKAETEATAEAPEAEAEAPRPRARRTKAAEPVAEEPASEEPAGEENEGE
jgi:large subunit ribosomal protein L21